MKTKETIKRDNDLLEAFILLEENNYKATQKAIEIARPYCHPHKKDNEVLLELKGAYRLFNK